MSEYTHKWNIDFDNVSLVYPNGYQALNKLTFSIPEGQFVSVIGLSGAGKTTLLKTINKMIDISDGEIYVGDKSEEAVKLYKQNKINYLSAVEKLSKSPKDVKLKKEVNELKKKYLKAKKKYRPYYSLTTLKGKDKREYRTHIGMVFQRYNLIYKSSAMTNVISGRLSKMNPIRAITGLFTKKDKDIALNALAQVNILETAYVRAEELSGGQMQRVALARTIAQDSRIVLADEPVGALDPIMAKSVMDSFLKINKELHRTVICNLHHVDMALQYSDRIIGVKQGRIIFDDSAEKVTLKTLKEIYGKDLEGFDALQLEEIWRKRALIRGEE